MKKLLKNLEANCERYLLLVFYSLLVVVIGAEVIRRFLFSYSSIWGEEVARYSFIYLVWIGLAVACKDRTNIRIDVILHIIPSKVKPFFYLLGDFVMIFVAIFALIYSIETFLVSIEFQSVSHGLRISKAWFIFAIPFGFTLTMLRLIKSVINDISSIRKRTQVFEGKQLFD